MINILKIQFCLYDRLISFRSLNDYLHAPCMYVPNYNTQGDLKLFGQNLKGVGGDEYKKFAAECVSGNIA